MEILIGIIVFICIIFGIGYHFGVKESHKRLEKERINLNNEIERKQQELQHKFKIIEEIVTCKSLFSYVADLYSDFKTVVFSETEHSLRNKPRPAFKAAEEVAMMKNKYKESVALEKKTSYKLNFLLKIYPELSIFIEDDESINEMAMYESISSLQDDYDKVRDYISKEEYLKLDECQRGQLALERYVASFKKSKWQIGRDYELYCGYIYRVDGWNVIQNGIERGLNDLGIDIIATKGIVTHIIQCKYWSQHKEIHENIICQLYGTSRMYELNHHMKFGTVVPVFITNIELSKTAKEFAYHLGVKVCIWPLKNFPRIKCNINGSNKIYHLPFDQQYDRTIISKYGEFYAYTVKEAFDAGFRRAKKHYPLK